MGLQAQLAASYKANSYVYFVLAASIIELIAACLVCQNNSYYYYVGNGNGNGVYGSRSNCQDYNGWAVAVGAISTALCLIFAIMTCWSGPAQGWASKGSPFLAIFLVILWIPGAFVTTFDAPFTFVGNGYYSAWAAFFFSLLFCQQVGLAQLTPEDQPAERKPVGTANV